MSTERPTLVTPSHPHVTAPVHAESRPGVWVSGRTWLPTEADLAALTETWRPADWPSPPFPARRT